MKMRNIIRIGVAVIAAVIVSFAFTARATPTLLVGSLVTVNNTSSNSPTIGALTYVPASQQFTISHGALTATNAFYLTFQPTLDGTNYVSSGVWYPFYTNACTEIIPPGYFTITNNFRVVITSTNSVQVGGSYGQ
jgi:hypothetical protein